MSFAINLYCNNSEKNKLDKDLTSIENVTGQINDETSLIDPVITCEISEGRALRSNYFYIVEFRRYYFITGVESARNGLVRISGHCDVLSSFKSEIRSNRAIISRQENAWNLYLNDGSLKTYQNTDVVTKAFPSGFGTYEYVLAVAGS